MGEIRVKFCGLKHQNEVDCCTKLAVDYIGFVFHEPSPRYISPQHFSKLNFTNSPKVVAVFQSPTMDSIKQVLEANHVDYIQIHGHDNNAILQKFQTKVSIIKACLETEIVHDNNCDFLLFDGINAGSGTERDFSFARNIKTKTPFFLAGGINISNYKNAIKHTNYIDLSSGVEESRGVKSIKKMQEFMQEIQKII